jgi:hypothetical protein
LEVHLPVAHNRLFEEFLSGTRIVDRQSDSAVVLTSAFGRPTLYVEYPESQLPLDAVVRLIKKELKQRECNIDDRVAIAVIANTVASRPDDASNIEHLNRCLSSIHSATLQQYVVLPIPCRRDYEAAFGTIKIQPFNPQRLLYWATRGGSSFPIDLTRLVGNVALERGPFPTSLLNWDVMPTFTADRVRVNDPEAPLLIRDAYFASVFEQQMNESMDLVRQDLAVMEAGALLHFNVESFSKAPLVERLGLFHWQSVTAKQRTWAVALGRRVFIQPVPATPVNSMQGMARERDRIPWLRSRQALGQHGRYVLFALAAGARPSAKSSNERSSAPFCHCVGLFVRNRWPVVGQRGRARGLSYSPADVISI